MQAAALPLALGNLLGSAASADRLVVPQALERGQSAEIAYRFDTPMTGRGFLDVEWSDAVGRMVERWRIPLDLVDASEVAFRLDIGRAVTIKNRIGAHLAFDGVDQTGHQIHRQSEDQAPLIASPTDRAWLDYQIIMWQGQTAAGYAALKQLGITAGMVEADRRGDLSGDIPEDLGRLLDSDLRCYLENIATDFYSPYHKWHGDRPVNWRFLEAKQRYWRDPNDLAAFIREPSLSDPQWLEQIRDRLMRNVLALRRYRPLYYSLGDEPGIGDLAAFWDFDFSVASLAAMRDWLKDGYGSLAALNRQWNSDFSQWEEVVPMTTREAVKRTDQNFSAWSDFKEWMGVAFGPRRQGMRLQWLLDRRTTGEDWSPCNASAEYQDDVIRTSTRNVARALEHMGLQHRFVSSQEVRRGELHNGAYRVLILPHTIAMAPGDAKEIHDFIEHGGIVLADGEPGIFDEHGRRAEKSLLSEIFVGPPTRSATSFAFGRGKGNLSDLV